jgi:hypothetical protein
MKVGIFNLSAELKDGVTILSVTDYSRRLVASGKGATTEDARVDAMTTTDNGDAREHLKNLVLPDAPFD